MGNFEQQVKEALRRGPQIDIANLKVVTDTDGDDIFDAINTALSNIGTDATVLVDPLKQANYDKANGLAPSTQLQTTAEGQIIDFMGVDVQMQDDVDVTPVNLKHDGAQIRNAVVDANGASNNISEVINVDGNSNDIILDDVDVANAPVGVLLDGVRNSLVTRLTNQNQSADVGTMVKMDSCQNLSIANSNLTGFSNDGIEVVDCEDLTIKNTFITTDPDGQTTANSGLLNRGTIESVFEVFIETDGDIQNGIQVEGFDVGGADQSIPDANRYDMKCEGVTDTAINLANADVEVVEGTVIGTHSGGKTTTAFEVGGASGHNISLDVQDTTRITDSQVGSTQAGLSINGHYSNIDETSTMQFAGTSTVDITLGPGTPQPAVEVLTGTNFEASLKPNRATTDGNGQVSLDWSDRYVFEDKPAVNVELNAQGIWYVSSFQTNADGNYTGVTIQVDGLDGNAVGSGVNTALTLQGA